MTAQDRDEIIYIVWSVPVLFTLIAVLVSL